MSDLLIRSACLDDLDALIAMFSDDALGGHGDSIDPALRPLYEDAFRRCEANPCEFLFVAERNGEVIGTFHLSLTNTLTDRGQMKAMLEAVQVRADQRGQRIGEAMVMRAMAEARKAGAKTLALTSNALRRDAHRFYERLGFKKSHAGFKLHL